MRTFGLIALGLSVGALLAIAIFLGLWGKYPILNLIEQKLSMIHTPKPPIGNLTQARDITGTWKSSLPGKGIQLYSKLANSVNTISTYKEGDMELTIDPAVNNVALCKIRYTNLKTWGVIVMPNPLGKGNVTTNVPTQNLPDEEINTQINISSSHLDFVNFAAGGVRYSMQGNYTTDIISGTITADAGGGTLKGEFHLMRVNK